MNASAAARALRLAAAVRHLGPRQAIRNLSRRALDRVRSLDRYRAPRFGDLEPKGRARVPFGPAQGSAGSRLEGSVLHGLGASRELGEPPDWVAEGSALWRFNLHYFAFLEDLDDARGRELMHDWVARYPPGRERPGWAPYPLSLRLRSWTRHLLGRPTHSPARALLDSIECQGSCLADRVETHLRGNHLLENAITLKLLAAAFRGGAVARWERVADRLLGEELEAQFLSDGGHVERSPMYHALLLVGLLDLLNVLPDEAPLRPRLAERLPALLAYADALRHPDGGIALFNDSALGFAPSPASLLAYAASLGVETPPAGRSFPETGYAVWRDAGEAAIVDCGPIGPDYVPAHAHADIFSFEMSSGGRRLIVDGGTSGYAAGAGRDWQRSTRAHSTVEIDGQDQCEVFDSFRVGRRGRPRDVLIEARADGVSVSGWHDGYRRLAGSPLHHRELHYRRGPALVVWDEVRSSREVACVSRLRLAPEARASRRGDGGIAIELEGDRFVVKTLGGEAALVDDRYAPGFGISTPSRTIALYARSGGVFGYALARDGVELALEADTARIGEQRLERRRWSR